MNNSIKENLKFKTFSEFCDRADEILSNFKIACMYRQFSIKEYKNYIYYSHKFSNNKVRDLLAKDKCWLWLMSYKYEQMDKDELIKALSQLRKGE